MPTCNKNRFEEIQHLRSIVKRKTQALLVARKHLTSLEIAGDAAAEKERDRFETMAQEVLQLNRRLQKRQYWGRVKIRSMQIVRAGALDMALTAACQQLLYQRYYANRSWDEIAATIGYSVRQTQRLHKIALQHV